MSCACTPRQPCSIMRALLRGQQGVLAVDQAREHGWSYGTVRHAVDSGRWRRVHRGVFVAETGRMTYLQQVWAAVLAGGADAAASHGTALWLADQRDQPPRLIDITLPWPGNAAISDRSVRVHRSTNLVASDLHQAARPPRTTVERAVLDCAAVARSVDDAVAVLARSIQRGLTTPSRLLALVERLANLPRRAELTEALVLAGAGAHSAAEVRYLRHATSHGLPTPVCQRREVDGGAMYLDVFYDQHPGRPVVVELDGRLGHFDAESWRRDMLRDNAHVLRGRVTLRIPALLTFTDPGRPIGMVASVLRREGWDGALSCRHRTCSCRLWFSEQ
jgi:putative AbiEi antitoxin of type IV toxin-antitoxin system